MSEASDPWAVLRADYLVSLRDQLEQLRKLNERLRADALDPAEREDLARRVHHLKGSGGCFGFGELSAIAERVEGVCVEDSSALSELIDHLAGLVDGSPT